MKKFTVLVLALILALSCVAALADDAKVYTVYFSTEDLAGRTDNNGFVSGVGLSEKNAVVLNADGTYEYIKLLGKIDETADVVGIAHGEADKPEICLTYIYTGTYTQEGDQVTLNVPADCEFNEDWGELNERGMLISNSGKASNGDIQCNKEGKEHDPLNNFNSDVYKFTENHDSAKTITVAEDGTYTYNAVASSDDD